MDEMEMEALEVSAKTVADAEALALSQLGLTRDRVEISILTPGRAGVFGIGAEDARILVSIKPPPPAATEATAAVEAEAEADETEEAGPPLTHEEIAAAAEDVLRNLLRRLGMNARITVPDSSHHSQ